MGLPSAPSGGCAELPVGVLSRSVSAVGVVGVPSTPSICGIPPPTSVGVAGRAGPMPVAPAGERATLRFLLDLVSIIGTAAAAAVRVVCCVGRGREAADAAHVGSCLRIEL